MDILKPIHFSPSAVAELIDQTQWSNDFSWEEISTLGRYFTAYKAKKMQVIFYEGAHADYMGLIIEGSIRISKSDANKNVQPLVILRDSQTFGELSLIDGSPRSGLAEALTDTTFVITTKRQILDMAEHDPKLAFRILWRISETISKRLRHTRFKLLDKPGAPFNKS